MREYHVNFSEEDQNKILDMFTEHFFKKLEDLALEDGLEVKVLTFGIGVAMTVEINSEDHSETIHVTIS